MKNLRPILAAVAITAISFGADAIIARRDVRTVTQPDGTTLRVRLVGDEASHYLMTEDGTLLVETDGLYTYATIDAQGHILSTGVKAEATVPTKAVTMNFNDIDIKAVEAARKAPQRRAQSYVPRNKKAETTNSTLPQTGVGLCFSTYPNTGHPKGLIVLVEYQDVKFTISNPAQYFNDMINKKGFNEYGATGSALEYFSDQSNGVFEPSFDVLGPVTLSQNRKYYGANNSYEEDGLPHLMVTESCRALDATTDFSQYDTDGDGLIDNVYVFYAGQGEADGGPAESVWPHSWDVREGGENVTLDGVLLTHYACSNEWDTYSKRPDGIGTFVHEFSHVMGLPDLYDTDGQGLKCTPGSYSVLDYGPYNNDGLTPPAYGAYERNAMQWGNPVLLDGPETISLNPIAGGDFCIIPTGDKEEFFLLENRQQTGWDKYIPGHGMLIWHIDYDENIFAYNEVNNTASHQYADIEEANNNANSYSTTAMAGWTFPGTSNKTSFTSTTTPALKTWANKAIDLPITDIEEDTDGTIRFNVAGGGSTLTVPVPTVQTPQATDRFFVVNWPAVEGATDYLITVTASNNGPGGEETCAFDNATLPDGWSMSTSKMETYTSNSNYGQASPSFKFKANGVTLTSPAVASDISSIKFWNKGQTINESSHLSIDGLVNGTWTNITKYYPTNNKATTTELTDIPAGTHQVRFVYNKSTGNVAVDDIVITYGGSSFVLPDYDNASTGGATTIRVDKLADGYDTYTFTVRATDGTSKSRASDPITVKVSGMSGVDNIAIDNNTDAPRYYNLQGIEIAQPTPGTIVIERRGNTTRKIIAK